MKIIERLFSKLKGQRRTVEKDVGAGPAIAAHSKDAKSRGKSGQNRGASAKKKG